MMFGQSKEFLQNFDSTEIDRYSKYTIASKLTAWLATVKKWLIVIELIVVTCLITRCRQLERPFKFVFSR